jgi:hypothetical protein
LEISPFVQQLLIEGLLRARIFSLCIWEPIMTSISKTVAAFATIATVGLVLSGCELQRAQQASDAKKMLIGMSREHILACMGSPVSAAKAGGTEVWTYASGNGRTDSFGTGSAWGGRGFASVFGSSTSESRSCKVDIVMTGGQVSRINYIGPTGGLLTKGEQCAFAVEACLEDPGTYPVAPAVSHAPPQAISPAQTEAAYATDVSSNDLSEAAPSPKILHKRRSAAGSIRQS